VSVNLAENDLPWCRRREERWRRPPLSEQQVEKLNNLVRDGRGLFLEHDIDIRLWGLADDVSYYQIVYHGRGEVTDELAEPFTLYEARIRGDLRRAPKRPRSPRVLP
jgi:hypothetical protein